MSFSENKPVARPVDEKAHRWQCTKQKKTFGSISQQDARIQAIWTCRRFFFFSYDTRRLMSVSTSRSRQRKRNQPRESLGWKVRFSTHMSNTWSAHSHKHCITLMRNDTTFSRTLQATQPRWRGHRRRKWASLPFAFCVGTSVVWATEFVTETNSEDVPDNRLRSSGDAGATYDKRKAHAGILNCGSHHVKTCMQIT